MCKTWDVLSHRVALLLSMRKELKLLGGDAGGGS